MTKSIDEIKAKIALIHKSWLTPNKDYFEEIKWAETDEQSVRELLTNYCESKGYEVNGFPYKHRELGKTNYDYDCDYFTWERWELYLETLATQYEDVFELYYFYSNLFWPDYCGTKEIVKDQINFDIQNSEVDFNIN